MRHFNTSICAALIAFASITSYFSASATTADEVSNNLYERSLEMLRQYMPLADSVNYPASYFEQAVMQSLKARAEMPWGHMVPEREFMHFVIPVRINNEELDGHREVIYGELRDRVKHLGMKDAILEINHWCHERATYQPSDARTHSPLATMSSAIGRCGEESTFAVAALRAMCIPARQVYTPRWAHTDDNHAWVEAWADGQWYFLGACEPEPVLDLGWFNAPASRGMLMHARIFGPYQGEEEVLSTRPGITDINVTHHYADVDTLRVHVTDSSGDAVPGARVSFRVYNYAEFFSLCTKEADANGDASLVAGKGDLLVWVSDGTRYNFRKYSVGKDRAVTINIDEPVSSTIQFDITPPQQADNMPLVSDDMRQLNNVRFAQEDSIRRAYEATFVTKCAYPELDGMLALSRGNHATILEFYRNLNVTERPKALALLKSLAPKDLSDVTMEVLLDHIAAVPSCSPEMFTQYVMCPRIANERLTPFRAVLKQVFDIDSVSIMRANPTVWVEWVKRNIDASASWYPASLTFDPAKVWSHRHTSSLSRDIFFVAAARSMGIPSRLDPVTSTPQWCDEYGTWHDASFESSALCQPNAASKRYGLSLKANSTPAVADPLYYSHFTLSRIDQGEPQLLSYPDFEPCSRVFEKPQLLWPATYMGVTGQRLANGGVLASVHFYNLNHGDVSDTLTIRHDNGQIEVLGSFDAETRFVKRGGEIPQSILSHTGRRYYVLGLVRPDHEPSNHALADIGQVAKQLEAQGTPIVLLTQCANDIDHLRPNLVEALPSTAILGHAATISDVTNQLSALTRTATADWPTFVIADTFNRVVFVAHGYTIGLGQQLLDTLAKLAQNAPKR